jgi:glycosyltransferase involved in cell wall biosynthesis
MDLFGFKKLDCKVMRILQLIDSLESGGAERMAINYANVLVGHIEFSGLVVTRNEGVLQNQIDENVSYLYLNKKRTIDFNALFKLKKYIKQNKILIVQAHGTSFFIAVLLKTIYPKVKIIWHEHYGARAKQSIWNNIILLFSSFFFSAVFVVNHQLKVWVKRNLFVKKVSFIPNFAIADINQLKVTFLKGDDEKRIICLANLKNPKNHIAILTAFKELKLDDLGWSVHLIGKDYEDMYSSNLKHFIAVNNLENAAFIYGSCNDVQHILSQATIGMLASTDEGFPVSLLEYGLAQLAVVSTNVGYCSEVIKNNYNGLLFSPLDTLQLRKQLQIMVSDKNMRDCFSMRLQDLVLDNYSTNKVIELLISEYKEL